MIIQEEWSKKLTCPHCGVSVIISTTDIKMVAVKTRDPEIVAKVNKRRRGTSLERFISDEVTTYRTGFYCDHCGHAIAVPENEVPTNTVERAREKFKIKRRH
jgi:transcription elongation factor Elf1